MTHSASVRILSAAVLLAGARLCAAESAAGSPMPLFEDRQLVARVWHLADERLALMPAVAAAKWRTGGPIGDPPREALVVRAAGDRAQDVGLAREPVENLMALQISAARRVQERLTAHWRASGFDDRGRALRLAEDIRPRLDRLTVDIVAALYLLAPVPAANRQGPPETRMTDEESRSFAVDLAAVRFAAAGSVERARAAGVLRIGTPADYAPFAIASGGAVHGADVQLAAGLAASLGLKPVFLRSSWSTLVDDLAADHFDLAVGGVSATPARLARALASVPLSRSGKTAIGRCRDRRRLHSLEAIDSPAVTVVENAGGTNESFARSHLAHAQLRIHADNRTVFDELLAGRADVMFTDETEIRLAVHRHPSLCRLLAGVFDPADKVFLLARNGHWVEAVNPWLSAAAAAGTPAALLERNLE